MLAGDTKGTEKTSGFGLETYALTFLLLKVISCYLIFVYHSKIYN